MDRKILIVDDEERNVRILLELLEDKYDVSYCLDGESALKLLETDQPAVVLLDLMMPGIDGLEVCKEIKRRQHLGLTKIILVSGRGMVENRLDGYEAGALDFIVKPFDHDELEMKVKIFSELFHAESELRRLNEKLEAEVVIRAEAAIKNERMAIVGMHAAEIVHDFSGPLTVIMGYLEMIRIKEVYDPKKMEQISIAVDRLNDISASILDITRTSVETQETNVCLNEVIKSEIKLIELQEIPGEAKLVVEFDESKIPTVLATQAHMGQIIGNLLRNASDSMFGLESKNLKIRTSNVHGVVHIEIEDTGHGIPVEIQQKIFEPMFTTKQAKKIEDGPVGTGLGLASVKRMIDSYGGTIAVESKIGEGATFLLTIPQSRR